MDQNDDELAIPDGLRPTGYGLRDLKDRKVETESQRNLAVQIQFAKNVPQPVHAKAEDKLGKFNRKKKKEDTVSD